MRFFNKKRKCDAQSEFKNFLEVVKRNKLKDTPDYTLDDMVRQIKSKTIKFK